MAGIKRRTPTGVTTVGDGSPKPVAPKPVTRAAMTKAARQSPPESTTASAVSGSRFVLATEPSEPVADIGEVTWLLYGEKKIGKTSTAGMFPKTVHMMFEPGGKGLRIARNKCASWLAFKAYVPQIIASDYKTVVIDTVDIAYDKCFERVCKEQGVEHPSEGGWGKVWGAIESEFVSTMTQLIESGKGVIFISHAEDKQFERRSGGSYNKVVPSMAKAAREFAAGISDVIAYYGYYGDERLLTISGSDELDAGHRLKYRFWTYCEGRTDEDLHRVLDAPLEDDEESEAAGWERVHSIPMGRTEQEAYSNIVKAFNNLQIGTGQPVDAELELSNIPAKPKGKAGR